MKMPSKQKMRQFVGLLMFFAFITILCWGVNPMPLKEFAVSMAKAIGIVLLGVGGVWLIVKR